MCEPKDLYHCINFTHMSGSHPFNCPPPPPPSVCRVEERALIEESEKYWYQHCGCDVECNRTAYQVEMSYANFPNNASAHGLATKFDRTPEYIQ